jgi:hypothetical protein
MGAWDAAVLFVHLFSPLTHWILYAQRGQKNTGPLAGQKEKWE